MGSYTRSSYWYIYNVVLKTACPKEGEDDTRSEQIRRRLAWLFDDPTTPEILRALSSVAYWVEDDENGVPLFCVEQTACGHNEEEALDDEDFGDVPTAEFEIQEFEELDCEYTEWEDEDAAYEAWRDQRDGY